MGFPFDQIRKSKELSRPNKSAARFFRRTAPPPPPPHRGGHPRTHVPNILQIRWSASLSWRRVERRNLREANISKVYNKTFCIRKLDEKFEARKQKNTGGKCRWQKISGILRKIRYMCTRIKQLRKYYRKRATRKSKRKFDDNTICINGFLLFYVFFFVTINHLWFIIEVVY